METIIKLTPVELKTAVDRYVINLGMGLKAKEVTLTNDGATVICEKVQPEQTSSGYYMDP
jgi:hypothetical protein